MIGSGHSGTIQNRMVRVIPQTAGFQRVRQIHLYRQERIGKLNNPKGFLASQCVAHKNTFFFWIEQVKYSHQKYVPDQKDSTNMYNFFSHLFNSLCPIVSPFRQIFRLLPLSSAPGSFSSVRCAQLCAPGGSLRSRSCTSNSGECRACRMHCASFRAAWWPKPGHLGHGS